MYVDHEKLNPMVVVIIHAAKYLQQRKVVSILFLTNERYNISNST